jgi:hypothetical protein
MLVALGLEALAAECDLIIRTEQVCWFQMHLAIGFFCGGLKLGSEPIGCPGWCLHLKTGLPVSGVGISLHSEQEETDRLPLGSATGTPGNWRVKHLRPKVVILADRAGQHIVDSSVLPTLADMCCFLCNPGNFLQENSKNNGD